MANPDPNFPLRPQNKFPWPLIAVVVAGLILAAFIFYLPRVPKRGPNATAASVPSQPFANTLQLTNVKIQPSPAPGSVYIQGTIANVGQQKINDVTVVARFYDKDGNVVHQDTVPMQVVPNNSGNTVAVSFEEDPLGAASSKEFRLAFDNVPTSWNHQAPGIEIAHVGFAGEPPASAKGTTEGVQTGTPQSQLPASDVNAQQKPAPGHVASKPHKNHAPVHHSRATQPAAPTNPPR